MDSNIDDGGPVHPCNIPTGERKPIDMRLETTREVFKHHHGLSIRDHFAAKAMQAIISTSKHGGHEWEDMLSSEPSNANSVPLNDLGDVCPFDITLRWVPRTAYAIADAMLEARKR